MFGLSGCGSSSDSKLLGEWWLDGSNVTIVITDSEIKMVDVTYTYTLSGNTINFKSDDGGSGSMTYELSEDGQSMVITEDQDGTKVSNPWTKISDNTDAEPSATYSAPATTTTTEEQTTEMLTEQEQTVEGEQAVDTSAEASAEQTEQTETAQQ